MLLMQIMRNILFVTAMLVAACAEQVGDGVAPDEDEDSIYVPDPEDDKDRAGDGSAFARMDDRDPAPDVCALLPADDSACAHACDPVALMEYVPTGTCATFTCELTNGETYRTGGCNN